MHCKYNNCFYSYFLVNARGCRGKWAKNKSPPISTKFGDIIGFALTLINQTQLIQFLLRLVYSIIYYVASYPETFNNNSPFATREVQTNSNT
jgi:hypothetical protein